MKRKVRKYIIEHLYLDFYENFAIELKKIFPKLKWKDIYYVESTCGWEKALKNTCLEQSHYKWFWNIWNNVNWFDSDLLDGLLGTKLYNLCRKGKILW